MSHQCSKLCELIPLEMWRKRHLLFMLFGLEQRYCCSIGVLKLTKSRVVFCCKGCASGRGYRVAAVKAALQADRVAVASTSGAGAVLGRPWTGIIVISLLEIFIPMNCSLVPAVAHVPTPVRLRFSIATGKHLGLFRHLYIGTSIEYIFSR